MPVGFAIGYLLSGFTPPRPRRQGHFLCSVACSYVTCQVTAAIILVVPFAAFDAAGGAKVPRSAKKTGQRSWLGRGSVGHFATMPDYTHPTPRLPDTAGGCQAGTRRPARPSRGSCQGPPPGA